MLQIRTTAGLIGINSSLGRQSIQQFRGEQIIRQPKAEMHIDQELPKVLIDQYQCFAEAGLKKPLDLLKEVSQYTYKKIMENIAAKCQEGDMLAQIEKGGNPLKEIARQSSFPQYDFNIDFIPKSKPKIEVTGYLNIKWEIKQPEIFYEVKKPVIDYQPGKVEISMRQWPDIEMRYVDESV
ncbi:MAG: DUF6470 family protein [Bacillota bacterium]